MYRGTLNEIPTYICVYVVRGENRDRKHEQLYREFFCFQFRNIERDVYKVGATSLSISDVSVIRSRMKVIETKLQCFEEHV